MAENNDFNWQVDKVDNTADLIRLILAILSGIKLFTAALGYTWFTDDLAIAIANLIPLLILLWTTWRHNFVTKKAKAQKLVLAKKGLLEQSPDEIIKE